jgi:hypothetical protein
MKDIDTLLREKYTDEIEIAKIKCWISLFLKDSLDFEDLPFKVKLFLAEWEVNKNCSELNSNVAAQIIIAKRSSFAKNVNFLLNKIKEIKKFFNNIRKEVK